MIYVGMDISSKSFVIHAIDERKKVMFKGEIEPTKKGLRDLFAQLGPQRKLVVFEAGYRSGKRGRQRAASRVASS